MCVTSLLCGPRADLWPFYGFLCKRFSLYVGKLFFFFYWNPFIFVGYGNDRFFSHTNPYILNVTQQCRCSYFELGLPVVCTNSNRDSETKFTSPEFCLPFAQTIDRPVCHVNGKQPKCPLFRVLSAGNLSLPYVFRNRQIWLDFSD